MTDEHIAAFRDKAVNADRKCVVCGGTDFRLFTVDVQLPLSVSDGEIRAVNGLSFVCISCGWLAVHAIPPLQGIEN